MVTAFAWLARLESALCLVGLAIMALALIVDVGARLTLGHGVVGAAQLGLVGMLLTALFGIGPAADAGEHLRPRILDKYCPPGWEPRLERTGHALTAAFFALLTWIAAGVAMESHRLDDLTSLLRWPVWLLQAVFVAAFALNAFRYALYARKPDSAPRNRKPGAGPAGPT